MNLTDVRCAAFCCQLILVLDFTNNSNRIISFLGFFSFFFLDFFIIVLFLLLSLSLLTLLVTYLLTPSTSSVEFIIDPCCWSNPTLLVLKMLLLFSLQLLTLVVLLSLLVLLLVPVCMLTFISLADAPKGEPQHLVSHPKFAINPRSMGR